MRFLLSPIGSDGDVEPFLGLAQRLLAAGHPTRLVTGHRFAERVNGLGVPFTGVGPPWDPAFAQMHFARALAEPNPLRQAGLLVSMLAEAQRDALPELERVVRNADVVICPTTAVATAALARSLGKKHISVQLQPMMRSRNHSPSGTRLGSLGNRIMWSLAASLIRRTTDAALNECVRAVGLDPWRDVLMTAAHSDLLDLVAASPRVQAPDPLWRPSVRVSGYWFVEDRSWAPDPGLEALVRGEAPIVIGFGSMMGFDVKAVAACIAEAAKDVGRRVVLQTGWGELGAEPFPSNVEVVGFVPHAWLFAHAACVVHHGGAGTTAAAFRAGKPQAIIWHLGDQPFWGHKVAELGVGPRACSHRDLNPRWLRSAIDRMLTDADMKDRAETLGAAIRAEDGAAVALDAIEEAVGLGSATRAATN